jgi:branched-chain amino acid transport system permease protein
MSFMFLAGYGGMVSLAQMTTAGLSGYLVAILGSSAYADISLGWPWWAFVPVAILAATVFGTLVGIIAIRTQGIYMIMITLAIAAAFYYFCNQNLEVFNGQRGFNSVLPPQVLGIDWHRPTPFYYLSLGVAAAAFGLTRFLSRSTFCLAVKACATIRGAWRRWDSASRCCASWPSPMPPSSPPSPASWWSGSTARSRREPHRSMPPSTSW